MVKIGAYFYAMDCDGDLWRVYDEDGMFLYPGLTGDRNDGEY